MLHAKCKRGVSNGNIAPSISVYDVSIEEIDREKECVSAFKKGNKLMAEQLLSRIPKPVAVTTMFRFQSVMVKMVSLLHLAAYWGLGRCGY